MLPNRYHYQGQAPPSPNNKQLGSQEQLEIFTKDDMDIRDFLERPVIDMRPPKPPRKTKAHILDLISPPGCPDYMTMNHTVMGMAKPLLPRNQKFACGEEEGTNWMACLPEDITSKGSI